MSGTGVYHVIRVYSRPSKKVKNEQRVHKRRQADFGLLLPSSEYY